MATASPERFRPADESELAGLLAADARPFEPIGHGSKQAIGRPSGAEPLDLTRLDGIVDYRPAELVLRALAATPLAVIEAELARHRQRLAFEPPDLGQLLGRAGDTGAGTIGGVLAANLSGSRRVQAGAARDHFLGVRAVDGRGTPFRAGGHVVKNVTGYDLPKLLAGSWGSLAVMTEVTLKVVPAAEMEVTLVIPCRTVADGILTLSAALGSAHEVSSAAFEPERGAAVRLEGIEASVAARRQSLLDDLGRPDVETLEAGTSTAFWQRHASAAALADRPVVWRLSVPPSDAPQVIESIEPDRFLLDWGGGLIWAAFDRVDEGRVRGSLREGHATLIKAPPETTTPRQHPPGPALGAVLARVKHAFDPDDRLSPGRMGRWR